MCCLLMDYSYLNHQKYSNGPMFDVAVFTFALGRTQTQRLWLF